MKRARPFKTRLRNIFLAVAGASTIGGTGLVTELMPKNPETDTQIVFNRGTPEQSGINISYIDQMWKQTLSLKSQESRAHDMIVAARSGDSWRVAAVLGHQTDLKTDGVKALAAASIDGHADVVKVLLKAGVPVNGLDDLAFMTAMQSGQLSLAVDYMDMVQPSVAHMEDAFIMAAGYGSLDLMEKMMDAGISADVRDNAALMAAAANGNESALERLFMETMTYKTYETRVITLPPPVTDFPVDNYPVDAFGEPEWNGRFSDYPAFMRDTGDYNDAYGRAYIIQTDEIINVRTLVDAQAQDNRALQLAALGGHVGAAKILVDQGADIMDPQVMVNAVQKGDPDMLKYLLSQSPMMVDVNGGAPLYVAVQTGNVFMAQLLMNAGANPNAGEGRIWEAQRQMGNKYMENILKGQKLHGPNAKFFPSRPTF